MFALKHYAPFLNKLSAVGDLKLFEAFGRVPACGNSFVMHQARHRLIDNSKTERAHTEAEIDIFIISGRKAPVETAELFKDFSFDQ